jgi:hypothetical protein
MDAIKRCRYMTLVVLLLLALTLPVSSLAAQDQPSPAPSPGADRSPSYQPSAPAGALRVAGDPPAVGDVIVEDSLTAPGMMPGRLVCTTGKNIGEFVGEGYMIKISGRCSPASTQAALWLPVIPGLEIPDGEVRVEAKIATGGDRTTLWIYVREQENPAQYLYLAVTPGRGWATVFKFKQGLEQSITLASRSDLATEMAKDEWNEYGIRLDGPNIWVLLNGNPILSAADGELTHGGLSFGARRLGDIEDDAEAAVVLRNLRVSRLAR